MPNLYRDEIKELIILQNVWSDNIWHNKTVQEIARETYIEQTSVFLRNVFWYLATKDDRFGRNSITVCLKLKNINIRPSERQSFGQNAAYIHRRRFKQQPSSSIKIIRPQFYQK